MQAYSNNDLENFHIQEQAQEAFQQGIISERSLTAIKQQHPYNFYRAGTFVRIALALLTVVCIVFAALLLFLLMRDTDNFSVLFFVMMSACYGLLEYMVKTKIYYNAGIDNTLQVFTVTFFAALFFDGGYGYQDIATTSAVIVAAVWLCIRFTDAFMALIAFAALLVLIFLFAQHNGNVLYMPFILMLASAIVYVFQYRLKTKQQFRFYEKSFSILSIATLISFYAASNVYIITEISKQRPIQGVNLPAVHINIFWILSFVIPFAYLIYGFIKRRPVFLRIGFLLFCATIVTIYHYTSFLSSEAALIIAGCVLTGLGFAGMRYFKNNKLGFTARSFTSLNNNLIATETLISIQIGGKHAPHKNIEFGGGSTGGAGASGNW